MLLLVNIEHEMVILLFCCVVVEQTVHAGSIKMCSVHAEHHKRLVERFGRRLSLADAKVLCARRLVDGQRPRALDSLSVGADATDSQSSMVAASAA